MRKKFAMPVRNWIYAKRQRLPKLPLPVRRILSRAEGCSVIGDITFAIYYITFDRCFTKFIHPAANFHSRIRETQYPPYTHIGLSQIVYC